MPSSSSQKDKTVSEQLDCILEEKLRSSWKKKQATVPEHQGQYKMASTQ